MKIGTRAAHLPGADLRAAALLVGAGLRDPAALRHGGRRRHLPHRDLPARDRARSRGAPPTCSPRAARPTAATARTRTACSTTTSTRWCIKPSPLDILDLYLGIAARRSASTRWCTTCASSRTTGSRPTLGAWGLGWEVWLNGMEVTQFTYFQQVGGLDCRPVTGEITYGLERLAMYLQGVESIYDIVWTRRAARAASPTATCSTRTRSSSPPTTSSTPTSPMLLRALRRPRAAVPASCSTAKLRAAGLRAGAEGLAHLQPAGCAPRDLASPSAQRYILRVRTLARAVAQAYYASREALGFPMLQGAAPRRPRRLARASA